MRALLRQAFDANAEKHASEVAPNCDEVLQAVEVVNRERMLIQRLKKGSPAEQRLADSFTKAIDAYNACREHHDHLVPTVKAKGLGKLFSNVADTSRALPKIDLPQQLTVQYLFPSANAAKAPSVPLEGRRIISTSVCLPKQSAELFQMKVLALLERYGIAASHEIRTLVKQTPIQTELETNRSICTLTQTLTLFPGQTVVVMGTSALDPKTQTISNLFPDSFSVSLESTQTGFPHPSQRTGWALGNQLLPEYPQRIDLLVLTASVFQRRKAAIPGLLPNGVSVGKAKKLIKLKRQAFAEHQSELLELHARLIRIIMQAAPSHLIKSESETIVARFFQALHSSAHPYERLLEINQTVRDLFIARPHQELLDAVLKGKEGGFGNNDAGSRYRAAEQFLTHSLENVLKEVAHQCKQAEEPLERLKWEYICLLGMILGQASKNIILQYLSEDLDFAPTTLSLFECKVQAAAYRHVVDFLDELSMPLEEDSVADMYQLLIRELNADIALFSNEGRPAITIELADYFQQRATGVVVAES